METGGMFQWKQMPVCSLNKVCPQEIKNYRPELKPGQVRGSPSTYFNVFWIRPYYQKLKQINISSRVTGDSLSLGSTVTFDPGYSGILPSHISLAPHPRSLSTVTLLHCCKTNSGASVSSYKFNSIYIFFAI
ncbi:hypothetical protein KIL84_011736 [Mauremys mutica]|uniref:Uncharacterized protein n=1 Tax=Mauremys mutica TaxID=74926 RepID=A0A9D4B2A4_9SAUR|nr:hypothetical protein KIL84_011736 [Mauremys mutica]